MNQEGCWYNSRGCGAIMVAKDQDFAVNRVLLARFRRAWPELIALPEEGAQIVELRQSGFRLYRTEKCHARGSGHPGASDVRLLLDSRFRGNDIE
ncbi:MAG TPA: hypothetical protein VHX61_09570 [Rhizomicrobium sp.]|nr:hypothetical protein [Rhizomicrobium sp.]